MALTPEQELRSVAIEHAIRLQSFEEDTFAIPYVLQDAAAILNFLQTGILPPVPKEVED